MREIKFRAWLGDKMHRDIVIIDYEHCIKNKYMGCPLNAGIEDFMKHVDPSAPTILMQYTGFKDKNGAEIYESDILGREEKEYEDYGSFNTIMDYGTVVWYEGAWQINFDEGYEILPLVDYVPSTAEVIGNIYEWERNAKT
jgi:uncharacterized phage protein (TIGR01671 family)